MPLGAPILTLQGLAYFAKHRKAVVVPGTVWEKPRPAVVLLHQQGASLLELFNIGMYVYKKEEKENGRARKV